MMSGRLSPKASYVISICLSVLVFIILRNTESCSSNKNITSYLFLLVLISIFSVLGIGLLWSVAKAFSGPGLTNKPWFPFALAFVFSVGLAPLFAAFPPGMALDGFPEPGFWHRYEMILTATWQALIAASIAGSGIYVLLERQSYLYRKNTF
ncbi:hypothetical protein HKD27_15405 [Gluconobacter sp. R75690]|uniref:hypothetical protein n=1 Tax=unclassified Gluconobacter TaxID=2644261 RepID=UPI00188B2A75|nr:MULTISPECIES: hypothetical protein [unclassified Gluconobacter]MBF0852272.1 hypothetical protein [Gluconobacter sp. R75690]MBF0880963.1 hypothetical protein [Gluconobacter sp. R75828]